MDLKLSSKACMTDKIKNNFKPSNEFNLPIIIAYCVNS